MKVTSSLLLSVTLLALAASNAGAAVIFGESMGTVISTTAIATHDTNNGFDNDGFTMTGTGDVRTSTASSGYVGSSGSGNIFLTNIVGRNFRIDGVSTVGYQAGTISLSFGAHKSTTASNMTTLVFDYSTDGSSWTPIAIPAQPTGAGTAVWRLVDLGTTSIPISGTLSLRWTQNDTSPQYRIDDVILSGTAVPETSAALLGALGVLGLLRRRR